MRCWPLALVLLAACREPTSVAPDEPTRVEPTPTATIVDETPQPVAVRINREYERRDADSWTKNFEHDGREVFDHRAEIVAALHLEPGTSVADVGAGTGLFTLMFAAAVGPTGRVFAVDVQDYFLDHIAARARAAKLTNVVARRADQRGTGLDTASIDVAFLCDAYHHLELPNTYLADLRRALVPGGRLVVIDYDRTRPGTSAWMKDHIRADPEALRAEIEAAGFTLIDAPDVLDENFFLVFRSPAPK